MNLREGPVLKKMEQVRRPLFSPRMTHSGWGLDEFPEAHLNATAHMGMDAIIVCVREVDHTSRGYADLANLTERAGFYGLDVYFLSYLKSLKHPDDKDAEQYYESTYGTLLKSCPKVKGVFVCGESCEFPSKDPHVAHDKIFAHSFWDGVIEGFSTKKPSPGWWPCKDYPQWINMVKRVIRKYNPEVELLFSTYNWGWAPKERRLALIRALPKDVILFLTFDIFQQLKNKGVTHVCVDYTIGFEGPGDVFRSEAEEAHRCGLKLYAMTNTTGMTWDSV
jgi:hypothetical protein